MTKQAPTTPAPPSSDWDSVREEANIALRRALAGYPFRPLLLLGPRPNARRAFLEDFARERESLGSLVSRIDAGEGNFIGRLLGERKRILRTLGNECPCPAEMPYDVETGGPLAELLLPDLLAEAGQCVRAAGKGWLLTVNDMHPFPKRNWPPSSRDFTESPREISPWYSWAPGSPNSPACRATPCLTPNDSFFSGHSPETPLRWEWSGFSPRE